MAYDRDRLIFQLLVIPAVALILLSSPGSAARCFQLIDVAIAMDTTASANDAEFLQIKAVVKKIGSKFSIGQNKTRLALISYAQTAQVVANFADINSLADFNAAVDKLRLANGAGRGLMSSAMQGTNNSVMIHARKNVAKQSLIVVKDGRVEDLGPSLMEQGRIGRAKYDMFLSLSLGFHVVAPGGPISREELLKVLGYDYALFRSIDKGSSSAYSLEKPACLQCNGELTKLSPCTNGKSRQIRVTKKVKTNTRNGNATCNLEIEQEIVNCKANEGCSKFDRKIGNCKPDGFVDIESSWRYYSRKKRSCQTHKSVTKVPCRDSKKCPSQVADIVILLDKSVSIKDDFAAAKDVAKTFIDSFNIGPNNVRVGLYTFSNDPSVQVLSLTDGLHKHEMIAIVDAIEHRDWGYYTLTNAALDAARNTLQKNSRPGVEKVVLLITDGASTREDWTFLSLGPVKSIGASVFAVGVGPYLNLTELKMITAPETDTNLLVMKNFKELKGFIDNFVSRLCLQTSPPLEKLCDENVQLKSIFGCQKNLMHPTQIQYQFDNTNKCFKEKATTVLNECKAVCTDPIDGKQYLAGEKWKNLCIEFTCSNTGQLLNSGMKERLAADNSCKKIISSGFKCLDDRGNEQENCECVHAGGGYAKLRMVID